MKGAKRIYKKHINLKYVYVNSSHGEKAIAEVFDDIFTRLAKRYLNEKKKQKDEPLTNKSDNGSKQIIDNS